MVVLAEAEGGALSSPSVILGLRRRIVDPLLAYRDGAPDQIPLYHAGTWGPQETTQLIGKGARRWHDP